MVSTTLNFKYENIYVHHLGYQTSLLALNHNYQWGYGHYNYLKESSSLICKNNHTKVEIKHDNDTKYYIRVMSDDIMNFKYQKCIDQHRPHDVHLYVS